MWLLPREKNMPAPAIIFPPASQRRLPCPSFGIDINFCRNPQCGLFAEPPDPYVRKGRPSAKVKRNQPRGKVIGSADEKTCQCGACGQSSIIKNNGAAVQEYRRPRAFPGRAAATRFLPERDLRPPPSRAHSASRPLPEIRSHWHGNAALHMQGLPEDLHCRVAHPKAAQQREWRCAMDDY